MEDNEHQDLMHLAQKHGTDKATNNCYIENFERHFQGLRHHPVKVLELGILRGQSLLMWEEYFEKGLIAGLDISIPSFTHQSNRIKLYQGYQDDANLLGRIRAECAIDGFDIIIDDASHVGTVSRRSFELLFKNHLKRNGIYVVEDWGTGYWSSWQDGKRYELARNSLDFYRPCIASKLLSRYKKICKRLGLRLSPKTDNNFSSHNHGMVGFIKELIDELAWNDIAVHKNGNQKLEQRPSLIKEISLYAGHAFITKA